MRNPIMRANFVPPSIKKSTKGMKSKVEFFTWPEIQSRQVSKLVGAALEPFLAIFESHQMCG